MAGGVRTSIHDALQPCEGVSDQYGIVELAVGHTGGTVVSHCHNITQKLQEAFLFFPTCMPVRGNTNQNFRVLTGKLPFVIWKNTSFSKLLLMWCKRGKIASRGFSLCQILYGKSEVCLKPCQGVPHLLLVKSETFGPAEKPSITGGAMCAVALEAHVPAVSCAYLSLQKPGTGMMLQMDIIQLKMLALGISAAVESGKSVSPG